MKMTARHEIIRQVDGDQVVTPAGKPFTCDAKQGKWLADMGAAVAASHSTDTDTDTDTGSGSGSGPESLHDRLVAAIGDLPDDAWTDGGKPSVGGLENAVGEDVSAAERDDAFKAYQEANDSDV